ncbi:MAG: hypothetical protein J7639_05430 [Paenibacillaceae bacterium]|nr:hypothetical protein [Paenibacillaceae bacterium]
MLLRSIVLCMYLACLYELSHQSGELQLLFFPTLGAFGFLFLARSQREMMKVSSAAVLAVVFGNTLYFISPGVGSFFATALLVVFLIQKLRLQAAPVVAASFVPYFAKPEAFWTVPMSVFASLAGLLLVLTAATYAVHAGKALIAGMGWTGFAARRMDAGE